MRLLDYKFKTQIKVRNYEIDWQGIVHNSNYLLYFETGRIEYLKNINVEIDLNTIQNDQRVVLVRNEINYKSPAKFDELLNVYTRISKIGNTSFIFEGMLIEELTQRVVTENVAYHVWLKPHTEEPMTVPDSFREKVKAFEGTLP